MRFRWNLQARESLGIECNGGEWACNFAVEMHNCREGGGSHGRSIHQENAGTRYPDSCCRAPCVLVKRFLYGVAFSHNLLVWLYWWCTLKSIV